MNKYSRLDYSGGKLVALTRRWDGSPRLLNKHEQLPHLSARRVAVITAPSQSLCAFNSVLPDKNFSIIDKK